MRVDPRVARASMRLIYSVAKLLPTNRNKITFLSRQSNVTPLDFEMLIDELRHRNPAVQVAAIARRLDPGVGNQVRYGAALLASMYHLATSKVCVLDSYWPAVSALDHKRELVVFQMWHAMAKLKKSGKATVGRPDGRSRAISELMRMHEGYDRVVAGAPAWNRFYMESFGIPQEALINIGLPRADYLVNQRDEISARILEVYPEFEEGPVVLYAPTFRAGGGVGPWAKDLVSRLSPAGFKTIVKGHANQTLLAPEHDYWECEEFSAVELLTVADFLVTDYSAISVEGALIDVRTFFYAFDLDEYSRNNGLNIDLEGEYPHLVCRDAADVLAALGNDYPLAEFEKFKHDYVLSDPGHSTQDLATAIFEDGGLCTH